VTPLTEPTERLESVEKTGDETTESPLTRVASNPLAAPIEQGCESVLSFFDLAAISKYQSASPYTVNTELDILSEIAQDPKATPGARVAAVKARRRILEHALQLAGILSTTRAEMSGDGTEAQYKLIREAQQITSDGARNALKALAAHIPVRDFTKESDECLKTVDAVVVENQPPLDDLTGESGL